MSREPVPFTSAVARRFDRALSFFIARWPECSLAAALLAGAVVAGCHPHC